MTKPKDKLIRKLPLEELKAMAIAAGFTDTSNYIRWVLAREIKKYNKAKRNLNKR